MIRKFTLTLGLSIGIAAMGAAMIAESADAQRRGGGGRAGARPSQGMSRPATANRAPASRPSAGTRPQVRRDSYSSVNNRVPGGGNRGGGNANRGNAGGDRVADRGQNVNRDRDINRDRDVNRDVNRNINRDIDVDVDGYHGYGYAGDYRYRPYAPVARAAVGTAIVAGTTAAIVGSYYRSLPTNCVMVDRVGVTYYQCGSAWYQPTYVGSTVQYVVVEAP